MHYTTMRDYQNKYEGTYVFRKENGILIPVYVLEVKGDLDNPTIRGIIKLPIEEPDPIEFQARDPDIILSPPKVGMCGSKGRLHYVERLVRRRYRQGFDPQNYSIASYVTGRGLERPSVYDIVNAKDTPLLEALDKVKDSRTGCRINRFAALVGDGGDNPYLLYRKKTVGRIRDGVLYTFDRFRVLEDTIRRLGLESFVWMKDGDGDGREF